MDESGDGKLLGEAAQYLYGEWWLAELAEQLNTRPPERPRQGAPLNSIREWTAGQKRPPLWVMQAMAHFVVEGIRDEGERSTTLKQYLNKLNNAVQRADEEGWDGREGLRITVVAPEDALQTEMINSRPHEPITIGTGVTATWEVPFAKAAGLPDLIDITLTLAIDIPVAILAHVIADWVVAKFGGRSEKTIINRKEYTFDHGELTKIIEETITHERK